MFTKTPKVTFQDSPSEDYVFENSVLKSKLQSKIEALSIMSKELDKCNMERDRFKLLVEQLNSRNFVHHYRNNENINRFSPSNMMSSGEILAKTKDHNNTLKLEVEVLKSKLNEALGDIKALRNQLHNMEPLEKINGSKSHVTLGISNNDHEILVQELEKVKNKYQQIQLDFKATLDEKEEIICDRDYYRSKVQRLNHQISYILTNSAKAEQNGENNSQKPVVDIDGLLTENKYLHERITQLQVEKEIIKRTLSKYKTLLENKNKNDTFNVNKGFSNIMTQKQVRDFLDLNTKTGLKRTSAAELKSLCLGLFEALNDKSIALQHQRKTNQILANRINELEKTLENWCNGEKYIPIFPSKMLLDETISDNLSVKSDERDKQNDIENSTSHTIRRNSDSSDIEDDKDESDTETNNSFHKNKTLKTVLPYELEVIVQEALAALRQAVYKLNIEYRPNREEMLHNFVRNNSAKKAVAAAFLLTDLSSDRVPIDRPDIYFDDKSLALFGIKKPVLPSTLLGMYSMT